MSLLDVLLPPDGTVFVLSSAGVGWGGAELGGGGGGAAGAASLVGCGGGEEGAGGGGGEEGVGGGGGETLDVCGVSEEGAEASCVLAVGEGLGVSCLVGMEETAVEEASALVVP